MDASIIGAPSSTKSANKARDPEMHQTRKGQQWYFGMKLHIGAGSQSGLAHSAVVTPANVHDKHPLETCLPKIALCSNRMGALAALVEHCLKHSCNPSGDGGLRSAEFGSYRTHRHAGSSHQAGARSLIFTCRSAHTS